MVIQVIFMLAKGQTKSKCPYENIVCPKIATNGISALKFFVASWGLPGNLVSNITVVIS